MRAGTTEAAAATTATEEAVAEAAAAQQEQRCHGGGCSGRRNSRGDGDNSSGGGNRGSSGNEGSGPGATEGAAATAVDSSLRSVEYFCFFSTKFISYVASYVGPIQTGFLRGFRKSSGGTGIVIPVKNVPQERKLQESGGFLQITNLVWAPTINDVCRFGHYFRWRTSDLLKTLAVVQLN